MLIHDIIHEMRRGRDARILIEELRLITHAERLRNPPTAVPI
jgi:hypothetical protein